MVFRIAFIFCAALLLPWDAAAQDSTEFVKQAQERLAALGFYSGPINGDFGPNTQAALAQFQLSRILPASGQLDAETSLELGVARDASAAAGGSAEPRGDSRASPENPNAAGG
jgi:peptidoglycan hydrolase-like protein with peptidoglycan-binding domain